MVEQEHVSQEIYGSLVGYISVTRFSQYALGMGVTILESLWDQKFVDFYKHDKSVHWPYL